VNHCERYGKGKVKVFRRQNPQKKPKKKKIALVNNHLSFLKPWPSGSKYLVVQNDAG